jgi:hypothetical protein
MLYQLPTGKVIEISTEQFLDMTDADFEYLIAYNYGDVQENPWFGSVLMKAAPLDLPDEIVSELTNMSHDEKLLDLDLDKDLIEE